MQNHETYTHQLAFGIEPALATILLHETIREVVDWPFEDDELPESRDAFTLEKGEFAIQRVVHPVEQTQRVETRSPSVVIALTAATNTDELDLVHVTASPEQVEEVIETFTWRVLQATRMAVTWLTHPSYPKSWLTQKELVRIANPSRSDMFPNARVVCTRVGNTLQVLRIRGVLGRDEQLTIKPLGPVPRLDEESHLIVSQLVLEGPANEVPLFQDVVEEVVGYLLTRTVYSDLRRTEYVAEACGLLHPERPPAGVETGVGWMNAGWYAREICIEPEDELERWRSMPETATRPRIIEWAVQHDRGEHIAMFARYTIAAGATTHRFEAVLIGEPADVEHAQNYLKRVFGNAQSNDAPHE